MNWRAVKAFSYRILTHLLKQKSLIIVEFLLWPFLLVVSFGLLVATMTNDISALTYTLAAAICWRVTSVLQENVSMSFVEDFWHDTMKQTWTLPFHLSEFVLGNASFAVISSFMTFLVTLVSSYFMFGTIYQPFSVFLICAFLLAIWGGIIGIAVIAIILRFGEGAIRLGWISTDMIILMSGVFYPLSILPLPLRFIAAFLPSTYLFEILKTRTLNSWYLEASLLLMLAYFVVSWISAKEALRHAKKVGRLVKFA